jgi:hypothetical protein
MYLQDKYYFDKYYLEDQPYLQDEHLMEINLENKTCTSPSLQITNQFISNNESIYNLVVCYEERILAMILVAHVLKQADLS